MVNSSHSDVIWLSNGFAGVQCCELEKALLRWVYAVHRWIGNAAEDGRAGTVFARLKVPSLDGQGNIVDHGVHAIVVPLRDASGQCLPGVEIRDCGYKVSPHVLDAPPSQSALTLFSHSKLVTVWAAVCMEGVVHP